MLNGHTHGGQIWPFHYMVLRAYPHIAGVRKIAEMTQVVSRGAGRWGAMGLCRLSLHATEKLDRRHTVDTPHTQRTFIFT